MAPDEKVRILIAVGHKLFQEGLRLILNPVETFEIVGMVNNGLQAIDVITELQPDIVILDIFLPEVGGIEVITIIKQKSPDTRALMVMHARDEQAVIKAIRAGAKGYLSKNTNVSDIVKAIQVVHQGEFWVQRKLVTQFINGDFVSDLRAEDRQQSKLDSLTPREQDVLRSLIKGSSNKEIANELFISEKTVKSHLNQVFKKLNVSRRLEAILSAIKAGLT
ncbi:MAG: response regulator transcription factor [Desulfobacteraceae bacterium]|nr:response regulator transcription factor [Desulfobacteraceae bacterium]MBC2758045.1 response regulator transcription factor [Desulfobacteraceae bacterium]